jgi:hypothetical protein
MKDPDWQQQFGSFLSVVKVASIFRMIGMDTILFFYYYCCDDPLNKPVIDVPNGYIKLYIQIRNPKWVIKWNT